jgi:hypothetical protein
MAEILVRPVPDEYQESRIGAGKDRASTGISAAWFTKGGLGVDSAGMYLIDADGERHAVPCPPNGELVRMHLYGYFQGSRSDYYELFVADEQHHRVAQLPIAGFDQVDGLDALAAHAGLRFAEPLENTRGGTGPHYGYDNTHDTLDLEKARLSSSDRHTLGRLFHKH